MSTQSQANLRLSMLLCLCQIETVGGIDRITMVDRGKMSVCTVLLYLRNCVGNTSTYLAHASICTHTHNMHMYTLAGDVYHPQVDGQRKRLMWKEDKVERCERGREDEYMFSSRADG